MIISIVYLWKDNPKITFRIFIDFVLQIGYRFFFFIVSSNSYKSEKLYQF